LRLANIFSPLLPILLLMLISYFAVKYKIKNHFVFNFLRY